MAKRPAKIRIGHLKILDHLILGMSIHRQKTACLVHSDLVAVPMNSWDQVWDAFRQKEIQGAFMPLPLALDLHGSGFPLECLLLAHRSGSLFMKARNITQLSSLKGKTVLVPSKLSVQHMLLHRLLASSGLSLGPEGKSDVCLQESPAFLMPQIMALDAEHDIGGGMAFEPFGTLILDRGLGRIFCTSGSLWKDHPCCGFVLDKAVSRGYPRAAQELVHHFLQSARHLDNMGKKTPEPGEMEWMAGFLDQKESIVQTCLHASGIRFDPAKLVPTPDILDTIQSYMGEVMGVLPGKADSDDFLNPAWAAAFVSETPLEN